MNIYLDPSVHVTCIWKETQKYYYCLMCKFAGLNMNNTVKPRKFKIHFFSKYLEIQKKNLGHTGFREWDIFMIYFNNNL